MLYLSQTKGFSFSCYTKVMDYLIWYNRCKIDSTFVQSLSDFRAVDLVRFVACTEKGFAGLENSNCLCAKCKREPSFVLVRCSEYMLERALDAEPVLIEKRRYTHKFSANNFVHYSFAHPSTLDCNALVRIQTYSDAKLVYVCTKLDTSTGKEDSSVFKINLVKRKTPGCEKDVNWLADRIKDATFCRAKTFETRNVSYFSAFTGDEYCKRDGCKLFLVASTEPFISESLRALRPSGSRSST